MIQKLKVCTGCNIQKQIWKSIRGKPYCQQCSNKIDRLKVKEKKEKAKAKRKEKREKITDKKLHTAFARLIKEIYPLICHACNKPLVKGTLGCQACHLVERGKKIVTWDIRNVYPGCAPCNGFDQSHQYELGKKANIYWGDGTAEYLRSIRLEIYQWKQPQKDALYELFTDPPKANSTEEVRKLILEQYLKIKTCV